MGMDITVQEIFSKHRQCLKRAGPSHPSHTLYSRRCGEVARKRRWKHISGSGNVLPTLGSERAPLGGSVSPLRGKPDWGPRGPCPLSTAPGSPPQPGCPACLPCPALKGRRSAEPVAPVAGVQEADLKVTCAWRRGASRWDG